MRARQMTKRLIAQLASVLAWSPALTCSGAVEAAAGPPRIGKPRPAPPNLTPMPPLPPAVIDNTLAVGGEDIKARKVETRLTVEVRVNGRGPYQFIVDSGADTSAVGGRIAADLQLPLGRPVILHTTTASNIVDRVRVDELKLGTTSVKQLELPALREQDLGGAGMIGIDALVSQRLMMDFEKHLIKIEDARLPPPRPIPGEIVITARRMRGQLILTRVTAGGLPLDAVIDTGSQITIGNSALRDKLVRRNLARLQKVTIAGVTGKALEVTLAPLVELRLGPVTLRNVTIAFADVPPFKVFGLTGQPALLLGTDVLEAFRRVSLDFRARKVRFQLRRCTVETVESATSSSGFTLGGNPETCGR